MDIETKQVILKALRSYRGDNYERAKARFARMSPEEMDARWGASGDTPNELLANYWLHVQAVEKAMEIVEAL